MPNSPPHYRHAWVLAGFVLAISPLTENTYRLHAFLPHDVLRRRPRYYHFYRVNSPTILSATVTHFTSATKTKAKNSIIRAIDRDIEPNFEFSILFSLNGAILNYQVTFLTFLWWTSHYRSRMKTANASRSSNARFTFTAYYHTISNQKFHIRFRLLL
jgi:hypothetical protein